jgi:hypothetical protein
MANASFSSCVESNSALMSPAALRKESRIQIHEESPQPSKIITKYRGVLSSDVETKRLRCSDTLRAENCAFFAADFCLFPLSARHPFSSLSLSHSLYWAHGSHHLCRNGWRDYPVAVSEFL